jgi:tetratricopeptide (TPR) repeat protein
MSLQGRIRGVAVAATVIFLFPAFSQTSSTTSSSSSSSSGASTTTGTAPVRTGMPPTSSTDTSTTTTNVSRTQQLIRVTGRVMQDDGTVPLYSATIQRVCNGSPHTEGYTDSEGYFFVNLGYNADVVADASETTGSFGRNSGQLTNGGISGTGAATGVNQGPTTDNRYANCDLRASLGGYSSQSINLANRGPMDDPNVGVILIHKLGESEVATTVTATTLKAPKDARKALQKGLELEKKNKPEEAIASLRQAVTLYPEFAFAWCELGKVQSDNGQTAEAHESLEAAVKAEPRWPEPYLRLSVLAVQAKNWPEVADTTDRVLRLNSFEYPKAYYFNAVANYNMGHVNVAEKSAIAAEKLDVQHLFPEILHLRGTIFIARHQYIAAAEKLRAYLAIAPNGPDAAEVRKQLAGVDKLAIATTPMAH